MKNKLYTMMALAIAVTVAVVMPVLAFAQDVAAQALSPTEVDLSVAVPGGGLIAAIFAVIALGAFKLLSKIPFFNKYVTQENYQKLVEPLIRKATAYGVGKLHNADWLKIDTKNEAVATAVKFALEHGGDLLKKFGISEEALRQKIEAELVERGWDTHPGQWVDTDGDGVPDAPAPVDVPQAKA